MTISPFFAAGCVVGGICFLADLALTHLRANRLQREIDAAKALMAPADFRRWPTFHEETLDGALRNMLQVKVLAVEHVEILEHDIHAYRGALGYAVPGNHDGRLTDGSTPRCGLCAARKASGPPYQYHELRYSEAGVPWRMGGRSLEAFNQLQIDGWDAVSYCHDFILLRRPAAA